MMMQNQFIYPLRVQFEDTDYLQMVFHSNYLNYMERARSEWAEQIGLGMDWQNQNKVCLVVHSANVHFFQPARLHQRVEVVSTFKNIRPASLVYDQYLRSTDGTDKILCRADIKVACVNDAMRPCGFPDSPTLTELRRLLT